MDTFIQTAKATKGALAFIQQRGLADVDGMPAEFRGPFVADLWHAINEELKGKEPSEG